MKKLLYILPILLLCMTTLVYAAPGSLSLDKNMTSGSTLVTFVVTGTDFGAHADYGGGADFPTALCRKYDDFEDNDIDDVFTDTNTTAYGTDITAIATNQRGNSNYSAQKSTGLGAGVMQQFSSTWAGYYTSNWIRSPANQTFPHANGQYKLHRMGIDVGGNYPNLSFIKHEQDGGDRDFFTNVEQDGYWSVRDSSVNSVFDDGGWHRLETWFKPSTGVGNSDGEFKTWIDGKLIEDDSAVRTDSDGSNLFGGWWSTLPQLSHATQPVDLDDICYNNTQARVELGNNPVFTSCSHREYQIPTAWSPTETTFICQLGTFNPSTENVYLFIVDSDGNASAGLQVDTGSGGGAEPDVTSPSLGATTPSNGAINIPTTTDYEFSMSDGDSGIDLDDVTASGSMSINGVSYAGNLTTVGNKSSITCTLDNSYFGPLSLNETANIGINIKDLSENNTLYTRSFTTVQPTLSMGGATRQLNGGTLSFQ